MSPSEQAEGSPTELHARVDRSGEALVAAERETRDAARELANALATSADPRTVAECEQRYARSQAALAYARAVHDVARTATDT